MASAEVETKLVPLKYSRTWMGNQMLLVWRGEERKGKGKQKVIFTEEYEGKRKGPWAGWYYVNVLILCKCTDVNVLSDLPSQVLHLQVRKQLVVSHRWPCALAPNPHPWVHVIEQEIKSLPMKLSCTSSLSNTGSLYGILTIIHQTHIQRTETRGFFKWVNRPCGERKWDRKVLSRSHRTK